MRQNLTVSALMLIALSAFTTAFAQTSTTQPAAPDADCSTPMALMVSYDHLAGQDPDAYLALYYVPEDPGIQRLAHVQARFDSQVGMLQKIVEKKWGDDAADQMLHALGLKSLRDVQASTIKESGRRASVLFADGTPGPDLFRVKKGWRVDLAAFGDELGMPVDDYLKQLHSVSEILPDIADGIADDKLKDPATVVSEIVKRLNAVPHH